MPDHFHLITQSDNLSSIMRSIKSYSAKKIIEELKKNKNENLIKKFIVNKKQHKTSSTYQIWQEGFHPKIILTGKFLEQKVNYIHYNPVAKGLVEKPEDWKYSSYSHYYLNRDCFIKIVDFE